MRRLDSLFDLRYGHSLELTALEQAAAPAGVNFVARAMGNNGVTARVDAQVARFGAPGEITVALSGNGVLSSFLQPERFVTGFHVMILTAKDPAMTDVEKLWWCRCIWENRHRYSYGRQANRTLAELMVPDAPPAWVKRMKVPTHDGLAGAAGPHVPLDSFTTWAHFRIDELFEVEKGKRVTKASRFPGTTRFVGASDRRNGITDHTALEPMFPAHTLSVPYNGSVGHAFYQDAPYFASDDVQVLRPKGEISRWAMLFAAVAVRHEKDRFSYGYKWHLERMRSTTIRLPALSDGTPDWEGMERYMRGLPFSAALEREEEEA